MEKFRDTMIPEDIIEYKRYVDIISGMGIRPIEIGEFYLQLEKLNDYSKNIIADCIVFHKTLTTEPHISLLQSTMMCMHKLAYTLAKNDPVIFNPSQVDNLFNQITNILASTNMNGIKIIARNGHIFIECLTDSDKPMSDSVNIEFNNAAILNYIATSDIKTIQFMIFTINNIKDIIEEYKELINDYAKTEEDPIMKETNMKELQNIATKYSRYKTMLNDFDPSLQPISINKFKEQLKLVDTYLTYGKSHTVNIPLTGAIFTDEQRYNVNISLHRFVILSIMRDKTIFDIDALNTIYGSLIDDPMLNKDKSHAVPTDTIRLTITNNLIKIHAFDNYEIPITNGNALLCISKSIPFISYFLDNIAKILTYLKKRDIMKADVVQDAGTDEEDDSPSVEEDIDVPSSQGITPEYTAEPTKTEIETAPSTDEPSNTYALGKWYINAIGNYNNYQMNVKQAQDEVNRIKELFDTNMDCGMISSVNTPEGLEYGYNKANCDEAISNYVALRAISEGGLPEKTIRKIVDQLMILPVASSISSIVLRRSRSGKRSELSISIKAVSYKAMAPIVIKKTCNTKKAVRLMTIIYRLKTVSELYSVLNMILDTIESEKA